MMVLVFHLLLASKLERLQQHFWSGALIVTTCASFGAFATKLVTQLESCFGPWPRPMSVQCNREKMWETLHKLRSTTTFHSTWEEFLLKSIGVSAYPTFYQFVVDSAFNNLLRNHFQFDDKDLEEETIDV